MKKHAVYRAKIGGNIKHRRSYFVQMSEGMYELVKNFWAGRPVHHDYSQIARDNQGAMRISEVKEMNNPYFGSEMFECERIEEVIK